MVGVADRQPMPGPVAGTVPARMPSASSRSRAALAPRPRWWSRLLSWSRRGLQPTDLSSSCSRRSGRCSSRMRTSSACAQRGPGPRSGSAAPVWRRQSRAGSPAGQASTLALVARGRAIRSRRPHDDRAGADDGCARRRRARTPATATARAARRPLLVVGSSGVAHVAHASNRWRRIEATLEKIRTPSTTTTPVDSCEPTPSWSPRKTMKRRDDDVRQERDDEDLVVEDAVEDRAHRAEHGVQSGDDGDGQVGLQPHRHGRVQEQADGEADQEAERGNHGASFVVVDGGPGPMLAAVTGVLRRRGARAGDSTVCGGSTCVVCARSAGGRNDWLRHAEGKRGDAGQGQSSAVLDVTSDVVVGLQRLQVAASVGLGERDAEVVRVADGGDHVGTGQRPVVHQDGLAGEPDGGLRREPVAVDRDRLGAGLPEPVDDDLQVAGQHPSLVGCWPRSEGSHPVPGCPRTARRRRR